MPDAQGRPLRADLNVKSSPLGNTSYDVITDIVTLGFPAAVTAYSGLALIWMWPFQTEVVATGGVLTVFFGVLLKISKNRYGKIVKAETEAEISQIPTDGVVIINNTDPMVDNFRLVVDKTPQELMRADRIILNVDHQG